MVAVLKEEVITGNFLSFHSFMFQKFSLKSTYICRYKIKPPSCSSNLTTTFSGTSCILQQTSTHTNIHTHIHTHTTPLRVLTWAHISVSVSISVFRELGHSMRIVMGLTANFLKITKIYFNISLKLYIAEHIVSQTI